MATKKAAKAVDETTGYAEAIGELESILDELESNDVDVDVLAEHVKRASELIELCRDRIGNENFALKKLLRKLTPTK